MDKDRVRTGVAALLVAGHLLVFALVIVFYYRGGFSFDQAKTTIGLIGPLFLAYTVAALRWLLPRRRRSAKPVAVDLAYLGFALLLPVGFLVYIIALVVAQAYHLGIDDFQGFTDLLALGEGVFAVYLGILMESLFGKR